MTKHSVYLAAFVALNFAFTNCSAPNDFSSSPETAPSVAAPSTTVVVAATPTPVRPRPTATPAPVMPSPAPQLGFTDPTASNFSTNDCPLNAYPNYDGLSQNGYATDVACVAYISRLPAVNGKTYIRIAGIALGGTYEDSHLAYSFDVVLDFSFYNEDQLSWIINSARALSVPLMIPAAGKHNFMWFNASQFKVDQVEARIDRASTMIVFGADNNTGGQVIKGVGTRNGPTQYTYGFDRVPWETP